jgi:hypothetical protein
MNYRIGTGKAMLIYGTAGFFDLLQMLLLLITGGISGLFQTIFGLIGYCIIWFMFATSGVGFFPVKKAAGAIEKARGAADKASKNSLLVFIVLMVLELIPEIGSFVPSITINSIMTVLSSREEDKAKEEGDAQKENIIRQKNQITRSENPNIIRPRKP